MIQNSIIVTLQKKEVCAEQKCSSETLKKFAKFSKHKEFF